MRSLKLWLRRHLPASIYHWLKYRGVHRMVDQKAKARVLEGPFQGMVYRPRRAFNGHYAKLLGVYERDLQPVFDALKLPHRANIAVIGAAEGYYAVGLARRFSSVEVEAYELESWIHPILHQLARVNGVDARLRVRGEATPHQLTQDFGQMPPSFVLMDVEGAEAQLADPDAVPALLTAELLIELHPMVVPDIESLLMARFAPTHEAQRIPETPRELAEIVHLFPKGAVSRLEPFFAGLVDENRLESMAWLHLKPRHQ